MPFSTHWIVVGKINSPHGIRGDVKIYSYTTPPENLLKYRPWHLQRGDVVTPLEVLSARSHGKTLLARFKDCESPEAARTYQGAEIVVDRAQLPALSPGEYYWTDLIGLTVFASDGKCLGTVKSLFETGGSDVLIIEGDRERLVPYLPHVIKNVDLVKKIIVVEWDSEL